MNNTSNNDFKIGTDGLPTSQVSGDHYKKMKIDVFEFAMANGLDALQFSVCKYVCRFRDKNGIEDLHKAAHCLNRLIEFETKKN